MAEQILLLVGRILVAVLLLFNGVNHFLNTDQVVGYAEYKGLPAPQVLVYLSGLLLLATGLSILLGVYPFIGSLVAMVFVLIAAVTIHNFWTVEGEDRVNELNHFLKNIGFAGGLFVLASASYEVWEYSVGIGLYF